MTEFEEALSNDEIITRLHAINNGEDNECLDGQSLGAVDLYGYARHDTIKYLLDNWEDALASGSTLEHLLRDVDEVIGELRAFQRAVRYRFALDH